MSQIEPQASQAAEPVMYAADAAMAFADPDFALGCECADPHLTIEMWSAEREADAGLRDPHH